MTFPYPVRLPMGLKTQKTEGIAYIKHIEIISDMIRIH